MAERDIFADRVFPLETVQIQTYGREHEGELENVIIHTGSAADEFARSMNALAEEIHQWVKELKAASKHWRFLELPSSPLTR